MSGFQFAAMLIAGIITVLGLSWQWRLIQVDLEAGYARRLAWPTLVIGCTLIGFLVLWGMAVVGGNGQVFGQSGERFLSILLVLALGLFINAYLGPALLSVTSLLVVYHLSQGQAFAPPEFLLAISKMVFQGLPDPLDTIYWLCTLGYSVVACSSDVLSCDV